MADDTREKYINPYTDFGFKKLFGTEMNKDLLISFLNALFNDSEREIEDVQYLNGENLGDGYGDRRSVFDVYCMTKDGSRFIVEMQKAEQTYFKDRSVYYATTPIRQQAPKGKWDYHLEDVYTVGILNFEFPDQGDRSLISYFERGREFVKGRRRARHLCARLSTDKSLYAWLSAQ